MIEKTKKELNLLLKECGDDKESIKMQKIINDNILEIVKKFCEVGHSGFSAEYEIQLLIKALKQENLTALTLKDDEWNDMSEMSGHEMYQNKRNFMVFKQPDMHGGKPYHLDNGILENKKEENK